MTNVDLRNVPLRPAWVEIDLARLRRNLRLIRRDLPRNVQLLAVLTALLILVIAIQLLLRPLL